MKILIYGINYAPELTGIGKYSGEMGAWLAKQGHEVRAVTAPPYYPDWRVADGYSAMAYRSEHLDGVKVMRCPLYVPRQPRMLTRLLHLCSFALSSALRLFTQLLWRPQVVVCVVPTQFCSPIALLFAALCGAKSVIHIQDYELDAMFGLGMASDSKLKNIAFAIERWLLRRFDRVSSISQSMLAKAAAKGVEDDRLLFFPNWSEVARFASVEAEAVARLRKQFELPDNAKVVLYSGNMGEKQGLESVVEAARQLAKRDDLIFLLVGRGAGKARLEALVGRYQLKNVRFSDLLPYEHLPTLLAMADCHLVVQKRGVADAVLPSKLTNILAVGGNSVITAEVDTELGLLCEQYPGIAKLVEPESTSALVAGIQYALLMDRPNKQAASYAKEQIESIKVLQGFEKALTNLVNDL